MSTRYCRASLVRGYEKAGRGKWANNSCCRTDVSHPFKSCIIQETARGVQLKEELAAAETQVKKLEVLRQRLAKQKLDRFTENETTMYVHMVRVYVIYAIF